MYDDTIAFLPVRELGRRLQAKQLSPVELAETYLARLERWGPTFNCVVTLTRERALREARRAEQEIMRGRIRGPLHGVPYGAKDLLATADYPTSWGAAPYRDQRFDRDATVLQRLEAAGAVLVAKLAMVELAGGMGYNQANASFTGPGITPWNAKYWSGGSSSGSGAAVAAGLVPFAIGSETWGSIMAPATFCGVSGLRPTYGRVSRHGAMALSWSMDKLGPLCRTADDCGLVLAAIAGADPADPSAVTQPYAYRPARPAGRRWRLGVLKDAATGAQDDVRRNFEASLEVVREFADLVPDLELPDLPFGQAAGTIIDAEGASAFEDLIHDGRANELAAPEDRTGGYSGLVVLAKDYLKALRLRRKMVVAFDEFLKPLDGLVHPTRATPAYPLDKPFREGWPGVRGGPGLSGAENLCGTPGIGIPNGFAVENLPTGLQFSARAFDENVVLTLAAEFQRRTDWHTRRPPLDA